MKAQGSISNIKSYYDSLSRWGKPLDDANKERIIQTLALIPDGVSTVLDLGCGDGAISNCLVSDGFDVTGVDISTEALKHFKGKGVVASLDKLPFSDYSFDLVICAEVLEHLPEETYERAVKEIERVARQYVIISTPNEEYLPAGFVKCNNCGYVFHKNLHLRVFNRVEHCELFEKFELLKTIEIGQWEHSPLLIFFEQRILGVYRFKEGVACPLCSNISKRQKLSLLKRIILKAVRAIKKGVPGRLKARWIASIYQRCDEKERMLKASEH